MPILRHNHEKEFTILPNSLIRNPELTLRDVGLLCYMLSLPQDWEFSIRGLDAVIKSNGMKSVNSAVISLEKHGYLRRTKIRDAQGRIIKHQWTVSDLPLDSLQVDYPDMDEPHLDFQDMDSQDLENRRQTKNISNKENNNKEKREQKALSLPDLQDVISYIQENGYQVDAEQFFDYYTARGWKVNGAPIADWTALVRNWSRRERTEYGKQYGTVQKPEVKLPWQITPVVI